MKKPLRDLTWTGSDGIHASLSELQGKVVILDFWATYCPPCKDEIPHLNQLHARYADSGLRIVGLNVGGEEDRPRIPGFLRETPVNYEIAFPEDALISSVFNGDDRIPQTLVINRNGQLIRKIVGFDDQLKDELDTAVQMAISAE